MSYTTANLNLVSQTLEGSTGTKIFRLTGTDALATVIGASYITDATKKGMNAGDTVIYDKTDTVSTYVLKVASIASGAATLAGMDLPGGGARFGATTSDTLGFFGTTAVSQPSGSAQAAVTTTTATTTTPFGYSTVTQANGIISELNAIRTALVNLGLIAGA